MRLPSLDFIIAFEPSIRLGFFLGVFGIMALWEFLAPRRPRHFSRWTRWPSNLAIAALNTVLLRAVLPTTAVGLALMGADKGWGLLNQGEWHPGMKIVLSLLALDLVVYLQHVMFHAVPALWRLHRVHHADLDLDVTSGSRFHPGEIFLSMGIKFTAIVALGTPAPAVLIFEVLLNATALFNHSNVRLPVGVDRVLRRLVVTPDMHRVHHSLLPPETNSNFGFNLPWWDRLFGTYADQPAHGHEGMTLGLGQFRSRRDLWLDRLLWQPLRKETGRYTINRR